MLVPAAAFGALLAAAPRPSGAGPAPEVTIRTFQFQPSPLEVNVGAAVRWANADDIEHIVTSGTPERRTGLFRASLNGKGTTMTFTFGTAGSYSYFCDRHQSMRGEIVVK